MDKKVYGLISSITLSETLALWEEFRDIQGEHKFFR